VSSTSETAALVALLRAGRRRASEYAELVEDARSAVAVLEDEHALLAGDLLAKAQAEIGAWRKQGIELLTLLDRDYPENLRGVHDRPPMVFVAGRLEPRDARAVAVIGSRKASAAGLRSAAAVAEHLVHAGFTVVSGLATGVDTAAHTAALERGGRTIGVIGTGLQRAYPPENAPLQRRIATGCAVISGFWPDAPPTRTSFPQRNALMSGIALATVIVEATRTSGARIQARLSLAHGRPVLLMESLLEQEWAGELATRPGTHVIPAADQLAGAVDRLTSTGTLVA
jgi:DNA processing protein